MTNQELASFLEAHFTKEQITEHLESAIYNLESDED